MAAALCSLSIERKALRDQLRDSSVPPVPQCDGVDLLYRAGKNVKHNHSKELATYWASLRNGCHAPRRADFDIDAIRPLVASSFVVSTSGANDPRFRFAGTKLCALFGRDLKQEAFASLWAESDIADIDAFIDTPLHEGMGVIAGAVDATKSGNTYEMLILPFAPETGVPPSAIGIVGSAAPAFQVPVARLNLTSWRVLTPATPAIFGRKQLVRKIAGATGLWRYEGLGI